MSELPQAIAELYWTIAGESLPSGPTDEILNEVKTYLWKAWAQAKYLCDMTEAPNSGYEDGYTQNVPG